MSSSDQVAASNDLAGASRSFATTALQLLDSGEVEEIADSAVQEALEAAVRLYVAKRQAGHELSPFSSDVVTATDVSIVTTAMLEAVDLELFELTLWSGWGRP